MNVGAIRTFVACAGALVLAGASPGPATAQIGLPRLPPPPEIPLVCLSEPLLEQPSCAEKQALFAAWMTQMGVGVTMHTLPGPLRGLLQDHYPNAPLQKWFFGNSSKQEQNNATTDCDRTYFNSFDFVNRLRQGTNLGTAGWYRWLVHEIRHYEQCMEVGGEDDYAKMWWDDLEVETLRTLSTGGDIGQIHDLMAMEADAIAHEDIAGTILDCCIHPETGAVVDPIEVGAIQIEPAFPKVGDTVTVSVDVSGGAEPHLLTWYRDSPPQGILHEVGTSATERIPLHRDGDWTVRLELRQAVADCASGVTNQLPCYEDERVFTVAPRVPQVTNLTFNPHELDFGESTTGFITVGDLEDGDDVTVHLSANSPYVEITLPPDVVVTGGGQWQGTASFPVDLGTPTSNMLGGRFPIRAWVGNDPSLGATGGFEVPTPEIRELEIVVDSTPPSRGDSMRREVYRIRVELDRAVRVPVQIRLSSSDPRALGVPSSITVEPGQTTATLDLTAARGLRDVRSVTVRAFHDAPGITAREATVTVRPGGR